MTYAQAIEHLSALSPELAPAPAPAPAQDRTGPASAAPAQRKFDLAHMRALCAALGDPQTRVPAVLIAGTNGKGSTAATLASIFTAAGYRTGLYTSPHLVRVNERIQLARPTLPTEYGSATVPLADGPLALAEIADEDFARLYSKVEHVATDLVHTGQLPWMPSFFERLTAIGFLYFAGGAASPADEAGAAPADVVVLEVGLGGRLDATNVVEPILSVITDIALDHQAWLGDTITLIAREKAGILRQNGHLISLAQHPEANQAIGEAAQALHVSATDASTYLPPAIRNESTPVAALAPVGLHTVALLPPNRYTVSVNDAAEPGLLHVDSPLAGEHQRRNLALAIAAAVYLRNQESYTSTQSSDRGGYTISNAAIEAGIRDTRWPGRLEFLAPNLLLDVAHNPAGAWTLRAALAALPEAMPRTLLFSCLRDKAVGELAGILFPLFDPTSTDPLRQHDHIVLAPLENPRAARVSDLLSAAHALNIPAHAAPHVAAALAEARQITPAGGLIIATGSVYLVGEIRRLAQLDPVAPPA